ncbi:zinc ABC transporter substrate-binding protein [Tropicibacter naphthalenivorans]|uniref:High-affinity zinc uptake system protein ZnuA n=1 Tax=Tropicibacter naphthalenivorans TaxID=441103 RepID=A0A0P1G2I1_9RHOB|nr:zinc ABC transporter substrate-binding protein [Tropicibacter naphthalenivorans]CUH75830.1 High-affinity zinc uptake system protein ZnuA precursor [Tropicibacter naphthalenivorans]SMC41933.1 zinc transport system substrate-binding protein [Tropicibacter naphthalenivorans]
MLKTLFLTAALISGTAAQADAPKVVTDIPPVHSLVSMLLKGVGEADLLLTPGESAHDFALRPSQARALADADMVVLIGEHLTPQLARQVGTLAPGALHVELAEVDGTHYLAFREAAVFAIEDAHDDHADDGHNDHGHGHDHDHGGEIDPHLWLAPENAGVWLAALTEALAAQDPANAETYRSNHREALSTIEAATAQAESALNTVHDVPLAIFHDAFQYYEDAFHLTVLGAISNGDDAAPGPARLAELRAAFEATPPACVLTEATTSGLLGAVTDGDIPVATLDPLGASLELGASLYPSLLIDIADKISDCAAPD